MYYYYFYNSSPLPLHTRCRCCCRSFSSLGPSHLFLHILGRTSFFFIHFLGVFNRKAPVTPSSFCAYDLCICTDVHLISYNLGHSSRKCCNSYCSTQPTLSASKPKSLPICQLQCVTFGFNQITEEYLLS